MQKTIKIDIDHPASSRDQLKRVQSAIRSGKAIAFPTDTFYGLGVDPFNEQALALLFEIKQRPPHNPILVLVAEESQLPLVTDKVSSQTQALMDAFWPGPLTLLFPALPQLSEKLTAGTGKIGVRLPDSRFTRKLISYLKTPLTASSANISGNPEPQTVDELESVLTDGLDWIVDNGPTPGGKASTVLDPTTNPVTLIREGAVPREQIESVLGASCQTR